MIIPDIIGKKFNKLVAIEHIRTDKLKNSCVVHWFLFKCECGKEKAIRSYGVTGGHVKSCGCLQKTNLQKRLRLRPYESLYNRLLQQANKKKKEITLTYKEFLEFTKITECHYCNNPIEWAEYNMLANGRACNLDRKDNNIGYIKGNCVVCCKYCNTGKAHYFTYNEWVIMCKALLEYRKHIGE